MLHDLFGVKTQVVAPAGQEENITYVNNSNNYIYIYI